MPVVFRDPRDVVISSFGYRTKTVVVEEHDVESNLLDFIDHYFEVREKCCEREEGSSKM